MAQEKERAIQQIVNEFLDMLENTNRTFDVSGPPVTSEAFEEAAATVAEGLRERFPQA